MSEEGGEVLPANLRTSFSSLQNITTSTIQQQQQQNVVASMLNACEDKLKAILTMFFHEKVKSEDVSELVQATQKVEQVLAKIDKHKYYQQIDSDRLGLKIFQRSLEKLDIILSEYKATLVQIEKAGQLPKFLNNTNWRKKIEQLNTSLVVEANILEEKHDYLAREVQSSTTSGTPATPTKEESTIARTKSTTSLINTLPIEDPEAKQLWFDMFGGKVMDHR